jgi:hypothetical protein
MRTAYVIVAATLIGSLAGCDFFDSDSDDGTGGAGGGAGGSGGEEESGCEGQPDCEACRSCAGQGPCAGAVQTCYDNSECVALDECIAICGPGPDCEETCRAQHAVGEEDWLAAFQCLDCTACPNDCSGSAFCQ